MANVDNPHGFRPLMRTLSGGQPVIRQYQKAVGSNKALFIWDAVARINTGYLGDADDLNPGTVLYDGVNLQYGAAATATNHAVIVSPDAVFEAQDDADVDGFAFADMGLNTNIANNAGSATTLISGQELDEATIDVTATLDMHLLCKLDVPDNDYGAHVRVECIFNMHRMGQGQVGV